MKRMLMFAACLLFCGGLSAENKKNIVDIDKELKQSKSTATTTMLLETLPETTPQTAEEVTVLGQLLTRYPTQAQRAFVRISDPKLAQSVIYEFNLQAEIMKAIRAKRKDHSADNNKRSYIDSYRNCVAIIGALGNMKSKEAIPVLREYLKDDDLSRFASVALGRIGDTESLNDMVSNIDRYNGVDLSGYGDDGLIKIVDAINEPGITPKRKYALINQIKGSKSPERKQFLKDLALNHKDAGVRDRAGQALLGSMLVNSEAKDNSFIAEWVEKTKDTDSGYWAITSIRASHDGGNGWEHLEKELSDALIDVLKTSTQWVNRDAAAEELGRFQVKESLPVLIECAQRDADSSTRGNCRFSYWKMTGEILPSMFSPKDTENLNRYFASPEYIRARTEGKNPSGVALEKAFVKYKELHR